MSKGDHRRPRMVDREAFEKAWNAIFGSGDRWENPRPPGYNYMDVGGTTRGAVRPLDKDSFKYRPTVNASREGSEAESSVPGEN